MIDFTPISTINSMQPMTQMDAQSGTLAVNVKDASFIDVFRGLVDNVVETNEQVDRDAIDLMLGNIDDLAQVQANIEKAIPRLTCLYRLKMRRSALTAQ